MSFQDYLSFLTRQWLAYMELPREERKKRKQPRESWSTRWFGVIPLSIRLLLRK